MNTYDVFRYYFVLSNILEFRCSVEFHMSYISKNYVTNVFKEYSLLAGNRIDRVVTN